MTVTVPSGLQPILELMGNPFPNTNTDGMVATSAAHGEAQATTDTNATQAQTTVAQTIGPDTPAYTGDSADAMRNNSADTGQLLAQASGATQHIPTFINGAAKITNGTQVAVIGIATVVALAAVRDQFLGGPLGPAEASAEIFEGSQEAKLALAEADQGTNITLSRLFQRKVTEPLQELLAKLKLPPGDGLTPATADGPALPISDTKLATENAEPRGIQKLNRFRRGGGGGDGLSQAVKEQVAELRKQEAWLRGQAKASVSGFFIDDFNAQADAVARQIADLLSGQ